jgi:hypothetical protein
MSLIERAIAANRKNAAHHDPAMANNGSFSGNPHVHGPSIERSA